jgi:hypothetical protein
MQQKKTAQVASKTTPNIPGTSNMSQTTIKNVLGPSEAQRIHEENAQKLSGMSTDEILEEKQKLMEMIDPSTLQFLKSRKQAAAQAKGSVAGTSNVIEETMEVETETEIKPVQNMSFDYKQEFEVQ